MSHNWQAPVSVARNQQNSFSNVKFCPMHSKDQKYLLSKRLHELCCFSGPSNDHRVSSYATSNHAPFVAHENFYHTSNLVSSVCPRIDGFRSEMACALLDKVSKFEQLVTLYPACVREEARTRYKIFRAT